MTSARSRIFTCIVVLALSVQNVRPFFLRLFQNLRFLPNTDMMFCRFYPFFKLFHQPYHHPHHPHHKVVRYVTYYDEPYAYSPHSYSHGHHHNYNSYSIDRKDDIRSRVSGDAEDVMTPLDHVCEGLTSPEKELCVLCWGETEPDRRRMCYKVSPPRYP